MSMTMLNIVRTVATALVAGLATAITYYPAQHWIPIVLTAVSVAFGIAVPSIGQTGTANIPAASNPKKSPFTGG